MKTQVDIAVVGAGIVGIACAYHLALSERRPKVALIDPLAPMSLTSAASGENYRNWWPHPVMTAFTDYSIDLMEAVARESDNRLHMTRRGYALATRQADPDCCCASSMRVTGRRAPPRSASTRRDRHRLTGRPNRRTGRQRRMVSTSSRTGASSSDASRASTARSRPSCISDAPATSADSSWAAICSSACAHAAAGSFRGV